MSKTEELHEFYKVCRSITLDEADQLIIDAKDEEEKNFFRTVSDCILQMKQKKVIAEKRF